MEKEEQDMCLEVWKREKVGCGSTARREVGKRFEIRNGGGKGEGGGGAWRMESRGKWVREEERKEKGLGREGGWAWRRTEGGREEGGRKEEGHLGSCHLHGYP